MTSIDATHPVPECWQVNGPERDRHLSLASARAHLQMHDGWHEVLRYSRVMHAPKRSAVVLLIET